MLSTCIFVNNWTVSSSLISKHRVVLFIGRKSKKKLRVSCSINIYLHFVKQANGELLTTYNDFPFNEKMLKLQHMIEIFCWLIFSTISLSFCLICSFEFYIYIPSCTSHSRMIVDLFATSLPLFVALFLCADQFTIGPFDGY